MTAVMVDCWRDQRTSAAGSSGTKNMVPPAQSGAAGAGWDG